MALATQCPHCRTTFRVAHDQLKLRAGLVRCGACKQIFNGIENLLRLEDQPDTPKSAPATPQAGDAIQPPGMGSTSAPEVDATEAMDGVDAAHAENSAIAENTASADEETDSAYTSESASAEDVNLTDSDGHFEQPEPIAERESNEALDAPRWHPEAEARAAAPPAPSDEPDDPLLRMTLMDFRDPNDSDEAGLYAAPPHDPDQPDPLDQAIEDLQRKPLRGQKRPAAEPGPEDPESSDADYDHDAFEEPGFVRLGRRRKRMARALRIGMSLASVLLLLVLSAQGAYVFRNQLAAHFPQTKPLLMMACDYLDCQVGLPTQIEAVSIESSELQTLAADSNTFVLTVLLRNHGAIAQAWPHMELTLNDANEKALARRVFTPDVYLPAGTNQRQGFAAQGEQVVRLYFELEGISASGYRVYLFFP